MKSARILALSLAVSLFCLKPAPVHAAPDPVIATLLSVGSTLIPIGVTAGLWATGRGVDEGIRFDVGMITLAIGAILGPTVGLLYAEAPEDGVVSLLVRTVTGGVMLGGVGLMARGTTDGQRGTGEALLLVGSVPTGLLALYDFYAAGKAATEARYRYGHAPKASASSLSLVPELELSEPTLIPLGLSGAF